MILSSIFTYCLKIVFDVVRLRVENCVANIMCHWMDVNELKLNHNKTEIMLIHSKYHTSPLLSYFSMGNESLRVVLDDNMLFDMNVSGHLQIIV